MALKKKRTLLACLAALAFAGAMALGGCAQSGHTGGVAATVNGTDIEEDKVTEYIEYFRESNGYTDEDSWASWLSSSGMTASDVRNTVVDFYVKQELEKQLASQNNVSVEDSELDEKISTLRANYESDEAWNSALNAQGYRDEQEYRDALYTNMLEEKLADAVVTDVKEVKDSDLIEYLGQCAASYDGMKRSSHILFASDDKETAEKVLSELKSGKISWNDAVAQYTTDEGTKEGHGDVGWDKMNSFVSAYTDALNGLKKGEMSELVKSDYGYHIIKCTDVFNAPDKVTKVSQCPDALVDQIRSYLENSNKSTAYNAWYKEQESKADINKNDMPSGVSYNVDLDAWKAKQQESSSESTEESK